MKYGLELMQELLWGAEHNMGIILHPGCTAEKPGELRNLNALAAPSGHLNQNQSFGSHGPFYSQVVSTSRPVTKRIQQSAATPKFLMKDHYMIWGC